MRRVGVVLGAIVIALLVIGGVALLLLTRTDVGRERARRIAVSMLQDRVNGIVRVGRVSGNLLTGATVHDISITDSAGAPFIVAKRATARYDVLDFLGRRVRLADVELEEPLIVLDRPPGGEWNYVRLFARDTTGGAPVDSGPGWGDWISGRDVTITGGHLIVRSPWEPEAVGVAEREREIEQALAGAFRSHIVRGPGGLQRVAEFRDIDARLPRVRFADPKDTTKLVEVASLRTIAEVFNPPAADVRDLRGTFEFTSDSVWWRDADATLPGSRISGDGAFEPDSRTLRLALRGQPVALADLRWLYPPLPSGGQGTLDFEMLMEGEADRSTYRARGADLRVGQAWAAGDFGITVDGDAVRFHDTNLRFAQIGTHLIEQLAPRVRIPRQGSFAGRGSIAGDPAALAIDADVTFDDIAFGRSHVVAVGEVGMQPTWRAEGLRLRLDPVQVALVRAVAPTFPIGGVVRGTATLDGSSSGWIATAADLVHEEGSERSRVVGRGELRLAGERRVDLDVRATPLSLTTIGRLAPALELRGEVAGPVRLRGPLGALSLRADMRVTGGGWLAVEGTLDLASAEKGYDLSAVARLFNAQSVIARLPQTSLTATAAAAGRGTDPATMRLRLVADVATSTYDSLPVDSARVRVSIANGMATVDTLVLRAPSSRADARGTFGLAAGRGGELVYRVAVDSLSSYARWLPAPDTGVVRPRPGTAARVIAQARADSARRAEAAAVERASTGRGAGAVLVLPDTPVVIPRDSLSGVVYAAGTLRGNVAQFDTRGRVGVEQFVFRGNAARRARAEYALEHSGEEPLGIVLAAEVDSALAGGFALDSMDARLAFQGGRGTVAVVITQQPDDRDDREQQYTASGRFVLNEDRDELYLTSVGLRFDTTTWRSAGEATLRWGGGKGLEVTNVDLRSGDAGRLYVNGLLPTEGVANLDVEVANFELAHLTALLQSDLDARGLISLAADISGTTGDLRMTGAMGVANGAYRGTALPELHGTFRYGGQRLTATASASRAGARPVATVEGVIPLALTGRQPGDPIFPDAPMSVDATIDSLPLELVPRFTDAISNLRGIAIGRVSARGTVSSPRFAGAVAVREGEIRLDVLGVTVQQVAGTARMRGDSLVIDSISGVSGGPVRLSGGISLATLSRPAFALKLSATEAQVIDNERGQARVTAEVTLDGPFEHAHVGGDITIVEAVLYIQESGRKTVIGPGDPSLFTVLDTSVIADRELFPGQASILANLSMDVTVVVNRDTWVRSPEANVEIYSDGPLRLHVDRAKQALALEGVLATELGQYTYLSRRFDIRRGSATFIGGESGLNPSLQITGEHRVQIPAATELRIQVSIGGTLEHPTISLSSDAQPPLTPSDLLSYMAFGRSSGSLLQFAGSSVGSAAGTSSLQTVGAFAGQQLVGMSLGVAVDQLEGRAARSLGVDVFNITPADTYEEVLNADLASYLMATEVEVGRYFNPRTFGSLQARLSTDTPPGLRIQHRFWKSYLIEGTFESRFALRQPSLSAPTSTPVFAVFGAFLVREWKF